MNEEVKLIPIKSIRILNPRSRDQKKFQAIIQSIKNLGLKKPIKVSLRTAQENDEPGYDLVAGQGRIEACLALGFKEIAAIVVSVSKADRLLMSLAENIARRFPAPMDMVAEIQRLKGEGYTNIAIGEKLDIDNSVVGGVITLMKSGEERLVQAAMQNRIPIGVAIDIAKTEGAEAQKELLKAYEGGQLNQFSIRTVRRLLEQRRVLGKKPSRGGGGKKGTGVTADGLVSAYQREIQRQKAFIRKARVFDARLVFLVSAFQQLTQDENFTNLLKAEGLLTMPKYLAEKSASQ
jgi:ParB family transcriptional regulator, chromosome partitioning protein